MTFDGIVLVDKPAGWTSHDVVGRMRRIAGQKRIGHTGTLDPAATGLLVVCLGAATRMVEYLTGHDKRYEGTITLGIRTATDDREGDVLQTAPVPAASTVDLRAIEARFTGPQEQLPPAFSAISIDGRRAYDVARSGGSPALKPRPIVVHSLALAWCGPGQLEMRVHCGPGTYIRSLARDIGELLGCGGHLSCLRRTHAGPFDVAAASTLEALAALAEAGRLADALLPLDAGLETVPALMLDRHDADRARNGLTVDAGSLAGGTPGRLVRVYDAAGGFLGVGKGVEGDRVHVHKVLSTALRDGIR